MTISTKNAGDIKLEKDNKKNIINNQEIIDIHKENCDVLISIEYDASCELNRLIEMVDYFFDNLDKIYTMLLDELKIDYLLMLEVTIYSKYIELCCWKKWNDDCWLKIDWNSKKLIRI